MRFMSLAASALFASGLLAAPGAAADNPKDVVVHEWGTFSTFSGSNGKNLVFQPYDDDLPDFTHGYRPRKSKEGPAGGSISLETPVLYFYTERPLTASVRVGFPKGTLTEWYPHAAWTEHRLVWQDVKVLPHEEVQLLSERKRSRYYAARETDATPLRTTFQNDEGKKGTEEEKFLFYRGVGTFELPLTVRAHPDGKFDVAWRGKEPLDDLILLRVEGGKLRFSVFSLEKGSHGAIHDNLQVPETDATEKELGDTLARMLTSKGLFEKEARAMVKTWRSAWFGEEGTRVLYVLPNRLTDELLPLRIEPKPDTLVRVLVGRHDVLTPEREKRIDTLVADLHRETPGEEPKREAAAKELQNLGRYFGAAHQEAQARLEHRR
jgi:hypothetical protein